MSCRSIQLVDAAGAVQATAKVADRDGVFEGTVDLRHTPPELRVLFDEFEEIVNGQVFVLLDDIQGRMVACVNRAIFDDGCEIAIRDLQVFPLSGEISFRTVGVCATV